MKLSKVALASAVLTVLSTVLLVENIALQATNRSLRRRVEQKDATLQASIGESVPAPRGHTLSGETISIPLSKSNDTLILVFSRYCGWCDQNWPHWEQLLTMKLPVSPVLVDLSMGARPDYLAAHHVTGLPFIHEIDPALLEAYRLRLTPQTILVGADQRVRGVWTGELSAKDINDLTARIKSDVLIR